MYFHLESGREVSRLKWFWKLCCLCFVPCREQDKQYSPIFFHRHFFLIIICEHDVLFSLHFLLKIYNSLILLFCSYCRSRARNKESGCSCTLGAKRRALQLIFFLSHSAYIAFRIIMRFHFANSSRLLPPPNSDFRPVFQTCVLPWSEWKNFVLQLIYLEKNRARNIY